MNLLKTRKTGLMKLTACNQNKSSIATENHCSFQRCGDKENQSDEHNYVTLDELYQATQIDDLILEKDRDKIINIECFDFEVLRIW